jgi:hypothetical protein
MKKTPAGDYSVTYIDYDDHKLKPDTAMTLNLTIAALTTASLFRRDSFSVPHSSIHRRLTFLDIHFSKSFHSLLCSNGFLTRFSANRCSFSYFLSSALSISAAVSRQKELFSSKFESSDSEISIDSCRFFNCHSDSPGAAIFVNNRECQLSVVHSLFNVCRCLGRGGAISVSMDWMLQSHNCFQFCRCGKEDGNDGSTVYANSQSGVNTSFVSAVSCPGYGDQCWYGIIILCNGVLDSRNINLSNSDVQYIVGLAHFRPEPEKSIVMYYTSVNQIHGNALGFIDFAFRGIHKFGSLVNDSSTSGIFYLQNTTTTLENFYFLHNTGAVTYSYGNSRGSFVNCVFSQKAENLGHAFGDTPGCLFEQSHATSLALSHLSTAFCAGGWDGVTPQADLPDLPEQTEETRIAPAPQIREEPIGAFVILVVIGVAAAGLVLWRRLPRRLFTARRRIINK